MFSIDFHLLFDLFNNLTIAFKPFTKTTKKLGLKCRSMTWPTGGPEKNNDGNKRRLNLLQATENSGPSRNYGKKQLGSHPGKIEPLRGKSHY
jgi:hypothetical protein